MKSHQAHSVTSMAIDAPPEVWWGCLARLINGIVGEAIGMFSFTTSYGPRPRSPIARLNPIS